MTPWLIVSGDFSTHGGMDAANHGLASYLASHAAEVHLVAHAIAPALASRVHAHLAPRPFGSHRLGNPLLRAAGRLWARRLSARGGRVVANGGNLDAGDVAWVHYVHAAYTPWATSAIHGRWVRACHRRYLREEAAALACARLVLCNSRRTAADVRTLLGVPADRLRVVYYGSDAARFGPVTAVERGAARRLLGLDADRPLALFAGALGDRRKNFDTVFAAWRELCARPSWDVDLLVAGRGAELPAWQERAASALPGRIRFLGFRSDMHLVLAACDVVVHPARYEAYGLLVHEALCRGLPAIVSAAAGVAERYSAELGDFLIEEPESAAALSKHLLDWRSDSCAASRFAPLAAALRSSTWDQMGREIVECVDRERAA
ncbi:MAG TPA: glycosyltransferase family 4 protein [Vicinamibacterales bacterium]|nr:glycosyltransferase family 4 protein [Vicinamibacterales bacterium]